MKKGGGGKGEGERVRRGRVERRGEGGARGGEERRVQREGVERQEGWRVRWGVCYWDSWLG
jgi:hypothetical protein